MDLGYSLKITMLTENLTSTENNLRSNGYTLVESTYINC